MNKFAYKIVALFCAVLTTAYTGGGVKAEGISEVLKVYNIGMPEGLSQNTVRSIAQDNDGFLWVGTFDGLNRYDGSKFVVYKPEIGNKNSITDAQIRTVEFSHAGNLWIRKYDQTYSCYNPRTDRIYGLSDKWGRETVLPQNKTIISEDSTVILYGARPGAYLYVENEESAPVCIWQDSLLYRDGLRYAGAYWLAGVDVVRVDNKGVEEKIELGCKNGARGFAIVNDIGMASDGTNVIRRFDARTLRRLPDIKIEDVRRVIDLRGIDDHRVLVNCGEMGIRLYDIRQEEFRPLSDIGAEVLEGMPLKLLLDDTGGTWFYNGKGSLFHYKSGNVNEIPVIDANVATLKDDSRIDICADKVDEGVYWISTYGGGLIRYDEVLGVSEHITSKSATIPQFLLCVMQDKDGNIWAGSEYVGLIKICWSKYVCKTLRPGSEDFSAKNNVKCVYETSDGEVWAGIRNGGLYVYDNELRHELYKSTEIMPYAFCEDKFGNIWVGTRYNGIYVFDKKSKKVIKHLVHEETDDNTLSSNEVFKIISDKNGYFWVATFGGGIDMIEMEEANKITIRHFIHLADRRKNNIRDIIQVSDGLIWTASADGLVCFRPENLLRDANDYVTYRYDKSDVGGLGSKDVRTICEDNRHRIWIGTGGGGLNLLTFEVGEAKFVKYTMKDGLPADVITSLYCSDDSTMWIGTENGLSVMNMNTNSFQRLKIEENHRGGLYNDHAVIRRSNGKLLFGTLDGLTEVDVRPRGEISRRQRPVITDVTVDGFSLDYSKSPDIADASLPHATRIMLPVGTTSFSISFATLNMAEAEENEYCYILLGRDEQWSKPSSTNTVEYSRLQPGEYTFIVRNSSDTDRRSRRVKIIIPTSWYNTAFMRILYGLLFLMFCMIPMLIWSKYRGKVMDIEIEGKLKTYKSRFFSNLSREIKKPMSMMESSVAYIGSNSALLPITMRTHIDIVQRNSEKLSNTLNSLLKFKSATEVVPLNIETMCLTDFLTDLVSQFAETAETKKIHYSVNVQGNWRIQMDKDKVTSIMMCLLHNAFKYTPEGGSVVVDANKGASNMCVISVTDSGIGIPKEKRGQLFSDVFMSENITETDLNLAAAHDVAISHHGTLDYDDNPSGGSIFTLCIPTDYQRFRDANILDKDDDDDVCLKDAVSLDAVRENPLKDIDMRQVVLLVDEDVRVRSFYASRLHPYCKVELAEDSAQALQIIAKNKVDVVIMGMWSDHTSSLDLTHRLRQTFSTSDIGIIIAVPNENHGIRTTEEDVMGPDFVLIQPSTVHDVLDAVEKLMTRRDNVVVDFDTNDGALEVLSGGKKMFFNNLIDSIRRNVVRTNFGIDDIAVDIQLQRQQIQKMLGDVAGCTVADFVWLWRMHNCKKLLMTQTHTIKQVMQQYGITDIQYFSREFKRIYGVTPSEMLLNSEKGEKDDKKEQTNS